MVIDFPYNRYFSAEKIVVERNPELEERTINVFGRLSCSLDENRLQLFFHFQKFIQFFRCRHLDIIRQEFSQNVSVKKINYTFFRTLINAMKFMSIFLPFDNLPHLWQNIQLKAVSEVIKFNCIRC